MATAKMLKAARDEAIARLRACGEAAATEQEISEEMADILREWAEAAAIDREMSGIPEDSPSVESCDTWGTGEGRFHGRM
jgi:hypothetical protein